MTIIDQALSKSSDEGKGAQDVVASLKNSIEKITLQDLLDHVQKQQERNRADELATMMEGGADHAELKSAAERLNETVTLQDINAALAKMPNIEIKDGLVTRLVHDAPPPTEMRRRASAPESSTRPNVIKGIILAVLVQKSGKMPKQELFIEVCRKFTENHRIDGVYLLRQESRQTDKPVDKEKVNKILADYAATITEQEFLDMLVWMPEVRKRSDDSVSLKGDVQLKQTVSNPYHYTLPKAEPGVHL